MMEGGLMRGEPDADHAKRHRHKELRRRFSRYRKSFSIFASLGGEFDGGATTFPARSMST